MKAIPRLRRTQYPGNRELTEHANDTQQALDAVVPGKRINFTGTYTEPMYIAWAGSEPDGVLLIRLREDDAPEEPILCETTIGFVFGARGIRIDSIDAASTGTRYRFGFLVIGGIG
jgi:hypothetical protein